MELLDKIEEYWTGRAEGYSQVNQGELATEQREKWKKNLMSHLKGKKPEETKETCRKNPLAANGCSKSYI